MHLSAVNSLIATFISLKTRKDSGGGGEMDKHQKSSMILVTVNQGFTDTVMDTARKAGARGGTIIRGRWVGDESFAQSRGITSLQAEKELIFIVVATEIRSKVMEAINREHGLESEAGAQGTFLNDMVMEEILEALRDIGLRDGISCTCGCRSWKLKINYSSVELFCAQCDGALKIPAATLSDIEDLCCKPILTIRGKKKK